MEEDGLKRQLVEVSDPAKIWRDLGEACDESERLAELERGFHALRPFEGELESAFFLRLGENRMTLGRASRVIFDEDLVDHFFDIFAPKPYYNRVYGRYAVTNDIEGVAIDLDWGAGVYGTRQRVTDRKSAARKGKGRGKVAPDAAAAAAAFSGAATSEALSGLSPAHCPEHAQGSGGMQGDSGVVSLPHFR